jgi:hypothetical protein
VLDAACDAFEAILSVIGGYEDTADRVVVAFLLAATQVANGRDALLFAPSLPPHSSHRPQQAEQQESGGAAGISAAAAGLSRLLASQLDGTATTVPGGADRAACHDAARCAAQIHALLAGGGP